jgi:hypothetical protein
MWKDHYPNGADAWAADNGTSTEMSETENEEQLSADNNSVPDTDRV